MYSSLIRLAIGHSEKWLKTRPFLAMTTQAMVLPRIRGKRNGQISPRRYNHERRIRILRWSHRRPTRRHRREARWSRYGAPFSPRRTLGFRTDSFVARGKWRHLLLGHQRRHD